MAARRYELLNDISDEEIRQTFSFLPHIVKIVRAASTSSASEPLLLKNSVSDNNQAMIKQLEDLAMSLVYYRIDMPFSASTLRSLVMVHA